MNGRHGLALALTGVVACAPVHAQAVFGNGLLPNLVGAGLGVTPRYTGASENIVGVAPGLRYQFKGSERYAEWYGTMGDVNLLDSATWQIGPVLNLRLGRHDVKDEMVRKLNDVDDTIEGGVMVSYTWMHTDEAPWRLRVGGLSLFDLGNVYSGFNSSIFANCWVPLSSQIFVGFGGGLTWSSSSYNRAFYGITPAESQASGLPAYTPDGGMRQWYAWPAVIIQVAPHWFAGAGVFYQHLTGDAAESPIVAQRGNRSQWTGGIGLGYAWK